MDLLISLGFGVLVVAAMPFIGPIAAFLAYFAYFSFVSGIDASPTEMEKRPTPTLDPSSRARSPRTTPAAVCDHMRFLSKTQGKSDVDHKPCESRVGGLKDELGRNYDKWAQCVLDQDNFAAAVGTCDPEDFK